MTPHQASQADTWACQVLQDTALPTEAALIHFAFVCDQNEPVFKDFYIHHRGRVSEVCTLTQKDHNLGQNRDQCECMRMRDVDARCRTSPSLSSFKFSGTTILSFSVAAMAS